MSLATNSVSVVLSARLAPLRRNGVELGKMDSFGALPA